MFGTFWVEATVLLMANLRRNLKLLNHEDHKIYTFYQAEYPDELIVDT